MEEDTVTLHPISFLGERLDDKLPTGILLTQSPHLRVRMNNRTDVIHDVFVCPLWLCRDTRSDAKGSRVARYVSRSRVDSWHKCADLGCAS
jgi:hypothetical protein